MTAQLTKTLAERVAARMRHDGFDGATADDVKQVWADGYLPDSHKWGASLASRILQEFEELGLGQ